MRVKRCIPLLAWLLLVAVAVCSQAADSDWPDSDTWMVHYMGGQRVGHGHSIAEGVVVEGRRLWWTRNDDLIRVLRSGRQIESVIHMESVETPEGQLLNFKSEMTAAGTSIVTEGRVAEGRLNLETTSQGSTEEFSIPWSDDWLGPFAAQQLLKRDPPQPGEERTFTALLPVFNQPAEFRMKAVDFEATEMTDGAVELLRVDTQFTIEGQPPLTVTVWIDRTGSTLKTHMPGMGQTSYVVPREVALADDGPPQFDLLDMTVVSVDRPLTRPHATRRIVYKAHLPEGDPAGLFVLGETQAVRALDMHTAEITVRAIRPGDVAEDSKPTAENTAEPTEADRAPNALIQSDDERVVALAQSIAPDEEDPWRLAVALEGGVHEAIRAKNFSQAFASAAEVAQSLEGDCTEHAVLLAALCRARGLPARVAIGLVYYPAEQGYAYHMWNEVWITGRWIPLDATLGRGGIGAAHLKLSESNLDGASAYSAFLPVLQVMSQLELEITSAE